MLTPEQIRELVNRRIKACNGCGVKLKKIDYDCQSFLGFAMQIEAGLGEDWFKKLYTDYNHQITAIIQNYEALIKDGFKKVAQDWLAQTNLNRLQSERDVLKKVLEINK
jgi:hypothetical protein